MSDFDPRLAFRKESVRNWSALITRLFPGGVPDASTWTDADEIVRILGEIARPPTTAYLFYPSGGNDEMNGARTSAERWCIEVMAGGEGNILRPGRLVFRDLGPAHEESYFRLEAVGLAPSGVYGKAKADPLREEVTELSAGSYAPRSSIDSGDYAGRPLPARARVVTRWFGGPFLVVAKGSLYNTFRDHVFKNLDHHARRSEAELHEDMTNLYLAASRAGRTP